MWYGICLVLVTRMRDSRQVGLFLCCVRRLRKTILRKSGRPHTLRAQFRSEALLKLRECFAMEQRQSRAGNSLYVRVQVVCMLAFEVPYPRLTHTTIRRSWSLPRNLRHARVIPRVEKWSKTRRTSVETLATNVFPRLVPRVYLAVTLVVTLSSHL